MQLVPTVYSSSWFLRVGHWASGLLSMCSISVVSVGVLKRLVKEASPKLLA